jgi:hypothetical protein
MYNDLIYQLIDVFCDRLKFGSTAALDCRNGQNKGRYCKKELLLLLVLLSEPNNVVVSTLNSHSIGWGSVPCTSTKFFHLCLSILLTNLFNISQLPLNMQKLCWYNVSFKFWPLQKLLRASLYQLDNDPLGCTLSLEPYLTLSKVARK